MQIISFFSEKSPKFDPCLTFGSKVNEKYIKISAKLLGTQLFARNKYIGRLFNCGKNARTLGKFRVVATQPTKVKQKIDNDLFLTLNIFWLKKQIPAGLKPADLCFHGHVRQTSTPYARINALILTLYVSKCRSIQITFVKLVVELNKSIYFSLKTIAKLLYYSFNIRLPWNHKITSQPKFFASATC